MPYFALFYEVIDDFPAHRTPFRAEHLRLVQEAHSHGELVLAGAFAEPADGALLIFCASDRQVPEDFARRDPYVKQGLVTRWYVRPWTQVIGTQLVEGTADSRSPKPSGIVRAWTARATAENAQKYREHFEQHVLPAVRTVDGYEGATLLNRAGAEEVEIVVITRWRSLEAIRGFAGVDLDRAVVAEEAVSLLTEWDQRVRHYQVVLEDEAILGRAVGPGER